jgi:hypothetical protein
MENIKLEIQKEFQLPIKIYTNKKEIEKICYSSLFAIKI